MLPRGGKFMTREFDLVVIGVGMASVNAARKCASAGWSVAVIDELPYGGTCALRGCDPKKMLRRGAEIIDGAARMEGNGVTPSGLKIDWRELVAFKNSFTAKMPDRIETGLESQGITTFHGRARFCAEDALELEDGSVIRGGKILIASGAKPRSLDFEGAGHLTDSTAFMELDTLPDRIVFVGGGFVSFEFAHIVARAGSETLIIDHGDRPLKAFDPDLVDRLVQRGRKAGVGFQSQTEICSVEASGRDFRVTLSKDGHEETVSANLVVHGAGRVPMLDALDLEKGGVEWTESGVSVTQYLQSVSNPGVYAAGDAADTAGAPLTPVAVIEGKVAASNMLKGNKTKPDYHGVPSAVFTIPELARVGLSEKKAQARGNARTEFNDTSGWYSNLRVGETCAAAKVIIDDDTDEILGAHLLGPGYSELINIFALAMQTGLKSADLKRLTTAYPSIASDLGSML